MGQLHPSTPAQRVQSAGGDALRSTCQRVDPAGCHGIFIDTQAVFLWIWTIRSATAQIAPLRWGLGGPQALPGPLPLFQRFWPFSNLSSIVEGITWGE